MERAESQYHSRWIDWSRFLPLLRCPQLLNPCLVKNITYSIHTSKLYPISPIQIMDLLMDVYRSSANWLKQTTNNHQPLVMAIFDWSSALMFGTLAVRPWRPWRSGTILSLHPILWSRACGGRRHQWYLDRIAQWHPIAGWLNWLMDNATMPFVKGWFLMISGLKTPRNVEHRGTNLKTWSKSWCGVF